MQVFVGQHQARAVPIADTDAETQNIGDTASFVPGTFQLLAQAPGYGAQRFTLTTAADQDRAVELPLRPYAASGANGAEASGDGVNFDRLIDDNEETNWASLTQAGTASAGKGEGAQVEGRKVTVDLAGDEPVNVAEVQVSAVLNGGCTTDPLIGTCPEEEEDTGGQSRFTALRAFDILTCNAQSADCSTDEGYTQVFTSADDAFPSRRPRPKVSDLNLRPFNVTDSMATHVRMVVRDNQCTGGPDFQGETNPDNDPNFNPDCDTTAASPDRAVFRTLAAVTQSVRAAELQVFSSPVGTPREVGGSQLQPKPRDIRDACPEGKVPPNSRQDDNGNTHEFPIDCVVWYEIAKGESETEYDPIRPVDRAAMATFIVNLIEKSGGELDEGDDAFKDDDGNIHEDNINKLAEAGIVGGKAEGVYDPFVTVTRGQMATFLVNAYHYRNAPEGHPSGEAPPGLLAGSGDYFEDDNGTTHEININRSAEGGFTAGAPGGGYQEGADVRRDSMASFLARVLDLLVEEGTAEAKQ
jgi:hypothetical protein